MQDFTDLAEQAGARFAQAYAGPEAILNISASKTDALWRIWAVGVALLRDGQTDIGLYWLEAAIRQLDEAETSTQPLLVAELYATLGLTQYDQSIVSDGQGTLEEAERRLQDLTAVASKSLEQPGDDLSFAFAQQIRQMAEAIEAGELIVPSEPRFWTGELRQSTTRWLIGKWVRERLLAVRSGVTSSLVRLLARSGKYEDGIRLWHETTNWIEAQHVTPPLTEEQARRLSQTRWEEFTRPQIDFEARVPLWQLYMARGDFEVVFRRLEDSLATFEHAESCISVINRTDLFRLMEARFNKANSLMQLDRLDEADAIYREVEDGFREVGDPEAIKHVQYARSVLKRIRREREGASHPQDMDEERKQLIQQYLASLDNADQ